MEKGTLIVNGRDYSNGGGSASGDNYSTEEQRIGTWIDGKPLYRKGFINKSISIGTGNDWVSLQCNVPNGQLKDIKMYNLGVLVGYIDARFDNSGNLYAEFRLISSRTIDTIIVEYTKTTDVAVAALSLDDVAPLSVEDVEE